MAAVDDVGTVDADTESPRKALGPKNDTIPPFTCASTRSPHKSPSVYAASPRKPPIPEMPNSARSRPCSAADIDRIRGLQGKPVEVPLRRIVQDRHTSSPSSATGSPMSPNLAALATKQMRLAQQQQEERVRLEAKREKEKFAAKMKREKEAREREAARKKIRDVETEKARSMAAAEAAAARAKYLAEEAQARARLHKILEEGEVCTPRGSKMTDEEVRAAAERMKNRWRATPPPRPPTDPFARWRDGSNEKNGRKAEAIYDNYSEYDAPEGAMEEEIQLAIARKERAIERDQAARRVLAHSSKTLTDALGLSADATDAQVESTVRKLLRLLHPDFSINQSIMGTRKYERIEAAFKRLNGLRDE